MPQTEIINTGEKLAEYMKTMIDISENELKVQDEIYLTDTECNFINVSYKLLNEKIELKKANI